MSSPTAAYPKMPPSACPERTGKPPIVHGDLDAPPSLPNELLERIIEQGWNAPMLPKERADFLTSMFLVSREWLVTLVRVSLMDVYILSPAYLVHYRRLIEGKSAVCEQALSPGGSAVDLCRSITRQIPLSVHRLEQVSELRGRLCGKPMRDLLSTFHYFPYFPDLESLAVEYYTAGPRPSDDSKTNLKNHPPKQLVSFRVPIVQLTLEYHFSQREPAWFVDALCFSGQQNRWARQNCVPWALPHFEHVTMPLSIQDQDLGDVLERCPHLEVVQEEVEVTVKIMSTSMGVEDERMAGTIIHGALCRPVGREGKENGAIVASGRALGFVLPLSATYAQLKIVGDGGDEARKVHILVRRCCFAM